ncbi:hypothetical protein DIPPA_24166 [Diplonema papillatum]|nr:hypothetical protein DIPPA_24166 [Diplonema papillatum]|eukprot:gene958-1462_t
MPAPGMSHSHRHTHTLTYPYAHSDLIAHQNPDRRVKRAGRSGTEAPYVYPDAGGAGMVPMGGMMPMGGVVPMGGMGMTGGGMAGRSLTGRTGEASPQGRMVMAQQDFGGDFPPTVPMASEALIALIQGRWATGGGLTHRVQGDLVTNERTRVSSRFERPTGNLVMLMGVAVRPSSTTHDRIEWADGDVWARAASEAPGLEQSMREVEDVEAKSVWHRYRVGSGKAMALGYGHSGTGWLGPADISSIIGQERSCEYLRHGLNVDTHRRRVRLDCREWETDTSPIRTRPSNHPHIEVQLGIAPQTAPYKDYRYGQVPPQ